MSLEKIGLLFLLSNKREIDAAKNHFLASVRELVLGLTSSLEVVSKAAGETGLPEKSPLVEAAIQRIDFILQMALKFLPKPPEASSDIWRQEILASIINVLDAEMSRLQQIDQNADARVQRQALQTVKTVLKRQFVGTAESEPSPARKTTVFTEKEPPQKNAG